MEQIHPIEAPSFFPTAQEWSVGLKWLREHPVIATASAAASTAVSVVSYLRNSRGCSDDEKETDVPLSNSVSWSDEKGGSLTKIVGSSHADEEDQEDEQMGQQALVKQSFKRTSSSLGVCSSCVYAV